MKNIAFIVACGLFVLGCSKHHKTTSVEVSLHLRDTTESSAMEAALGGFALKAGFSQKIYSNHEKADTSRPFDVEYQNPAIRTFNAIAMDYTGKNAGACLTIDIVFEDGSADLKSVLKGLNSVIHSNIHDGRTIYFDSKCGYRSTIIE